MPLCRLRENAWSSYTQRASERQWSASCRAQHQNFGRNFPSNRQTLSFPEERMRHAVRSAISLLALLFALPSFASIAGTVMNGDGQAIAGAKISVYALETADARRARIVSATPLRKALGTATADANGSFRVDVPKEQSFVDLRVDAAGYAPDSSWSLANDDAGTIVLTKAPAKTGTITANGKPVADARVFWFSGAGVESGAVTDAAGKYSVPDPSKWAARIVVIHLDYATFSEV